MQMQSFTNYVAYRDTRTGCSRIGHYDLSAKTIRPLSFFSGTPIENLYQVIEVGPSSNIISSGEPFPASDIEILPPLSERDVLCVGKNYAEHAKEFNRSGYDSSDKVDQPTCPVIFTKRCTSIIADGQEIYLHPNFTQTVDYEGEIGVIIGKPGFRIAEADAMNYVWGYTIINDVTARERQRDHKQFYLGKSPDTFCPMGPIAVPAHELDKVLRVQTHVNGELRQDATTNDLIFSIPNLIKTLSEAQTLMPGDLLATGTPAGVGIGMKPPIYLKPGDNIAISVTGLGTLTNRVADPSLPNPVVEQARNMSHLTHTNVSRNVDLSSLTQINGKPLYYRATGLESGAPIVFVHGLCGNTEAFTPLIKRMSLEQSHRIHVYDFEGHGLSPTSPLSKVSIQSLAEDLNGVFQYASISSGATLVAHSTGTLIAVQFVISNPGKVSKLVLFGPLPSPFPEDKRRALLAQAEKARTHGMAALADAFSQDDISETTKRSNPLAIAAVRMSILGQDPEGYAKVCTALANATALDFGAIQATTLIVTGRDDTISPPDLCKSYVVGPMRGNAGLEVVEGIGHWHVFEDVEGVVNAIQGFL